MTKLYVICVSELLHRKLCHIKTNKGFRRIEQAIEFALNEVSDEV